jgi:hypothetical protein
VNDTGDDEIVSSHEILYILTQGDVIRANAVNRLPAEDAYRWMLIKLRCLSRVSIPGDMMDQVS